MLFLLFYYFSFFVFIHILLLPFCIFCAMSSPLFQESCVVVFILRWNLLLISFEVVLPTRGQREREGERECGKKANNDGWICCFMFMFHTYFVFVLFSLKTYYTFLYDLLTFVRAFRLCFTD